MGSVHYQFLNQDKKEIKFLIRWIWTEEVGQWEDEENWEVVDAIQTNDRRGNEEGGGPELSLKGQWPY